MFHEVNADNAKGGLLVLHGFLLRDTVQPVTCCWPKPVHD